MSSIVPSLDGLVGGHIVDNPGLVGLWDLDLRWEQDSQSAANSVETLYGLDLYCRT